MIKKFLRFSFASFGIGSALALAPILLAGSSAQAQVVVDGRFDEYGVNTAPTLTDGVTGPVVRDLQIFMDELGYYNGPIDGIYDADVQGSVSAFQADYGLYQDGIVGYNTWNSLLGMDENEIFEEGDRYDTTTGIYSDYEDEGLFD